MANAGPAPSAPPTTDAALAADNQRMEEKLNGIHVNLDKDEVGLQNVQAAALHIDKLDVSVPGLKKMLDPLLDPTSLSAGSTPKLPDISQLEKTPITVQDAHVRLPQSAVNQVLSHTEVSGVSGLSMSVGDGGELDLKGTAHESILSLPFDVKGHIEADGPEKIRFSVQNTTIGGFLPVPKLVTGLFASLASRELAKAHVEQQGTDFLVDVGGYIPANVNVGLRGITTQNGEVVVDAGSRPAG